MIKYVAAFAAALLPLTSHAQSADATLDRAAAVYSQLRSIRADFKQTLTNPLTGTTAVTRGTLLRRKPNLLSISFDNGDHIVADGTDLWIYVPSSVPGQVIRQSSRAAATSTFDPAGEFLTSPRSRYTAAAGGPATINGRASHLLTLTPKSGAAPFSKVRLWVDDADGSVRQFEVTERNGLSRVILITHLSMNPVLARSSFRFTPPKGVRVVDQPLQQLN
jgi:outer membrane lipoprotein carrier protein